MSSQEDKEHDFVRARIVQFGQRTYGWFKTFIQTYSAIVGGSVWLRLKFKEPAPIEYAHLSSALVFLLFLISLVIIIDSHISWCGYRDRLYVLEPKVGPRKFKSLITPTLMLFVMAVATVGFVCFNPFEFVAPK